MSAFFHVCFDAADEFLVGVVAVRRCTCAGIVELAGLQVLTKDESKASSGEQLSAMDVLKVLESQIDRLAAEEHVGWVHQKLENAYQCSPERVEALRKHPAMVPYSELPEADNGIKVVLTSRLVLIG